MSERRLARLFVGVLVAGSLAAAGAGAGVAQAAAPGSVTFGTCVAEPLSELCGGAPGYGLEAPVGVAVSPDGDNVYVAGAGGGAVAVLDRGSDGSLTFASCVGGTNSGVDSQCATAAGVLTPDAVAVSPDGKDVYVLDHGQIDLFARAATGALSWIGCVGDADQGGCSATAPGHTLYPYHYPGAIVVSPNGANVYTATDDGGGPNGAIDAFARSASGALTSLGCVAAAGGTESGCTTSSPAIVAAGSLAISADGYLFAGGGSAVASFKVTGNGTLTPAGCLGAAGGCAAASDLAGADASPNALALSPDGSTLYVAAHQSQTIDELAVKSTGGLAEVGCVGPGASGCGVVATPVCGPTGLAISGDGTDLYALDGCSDALLTFARSTSGALAYQGCLADTISSYSCAATGPGLNGPLALALTPDGSQVIVTGEGKDSVAAFARTASVAANITIASPADGGTYVVGQSLRASYSCARFQGGDPVNLCAGPVPDGTTLDTSTPGHRTFTVIATDVAGLQTKQTVSYTVVGLGTPGAAGGEGGGTSAVGGGQPAAGGGKPPVGGVASAGGSTLTVHGFGQSHKRWSEHRGGHGHLAAQYGTAFSFVLSQAASVTLTFTTRVHRKTVTAGDLTVRGKAGANQVAFYGRIASKAHLAPGVYTVTVTATTSGGHHASASGLSFTILAKRPAR